MCECCINATLAKKQAQRKNCAILTALNKLLSNTTHSNTMQTTQAQAQAAALQAVTAAVQQHVGYALAVGEDSTAGVYIYATPQTCHAVFSTALQQLQATNVQGLQAVATATGQQDHSVTFMHKGHELYFTTTYESADNALEEDVV